MAVSRGIYLWGTLCGEFLVFLDLEFFGPAENWQIKVSIKSPIEHEGILPLTCLHVRELYISSFAPTRIQNNVLAWYFPPGRDFISLSS